MRYRNAQRLKLSSKVKCKTTAEKMTVINVVDKPEGLKNPTVFIECRDRDGLWREFAHTEVELVRK
jgi:hypothetical protein